MPIPTFDKLMLPVLKLAAVGMCKNSEARKRMCEYFHLTEEERSRLLPSGKTTFIDNRTNWAITYMRHARLLESPKRGVFSITERGKRVLASDPQEITVNSLCSYPEFAEWRSSGGHDGKKPEKKPDSDSRTPEENIDAYLNQLDQELEEDLLKRVMEKSPAFFEELVVKLLVAMGYGGSVENPGKSIGKTGDGGVDGVIDQDVLGLDRIYIQAKRYTAGNNVSAGAIRDFFGSLDNKKAAKGLFITTSDFTKDARATAATLSKRIVLIDGRQLTRLMIRYDVGCRIERTLYIKKIDEDFFAEVLE